MKFSAKQYATALFDALAGTATKDHDKVLDNFVNVLAIHNDLKLFDNIAEEFHKMELEAKGQKSVDVTSAKPLDRESEKQLVKELNELLNTKVELKKKVDAGLVGGVVIQMEDTVIDASVKRTLENLKGKLEE